MTTPATTTPAAPAVPLDAPAVPLDAMLREYLDATERLRMTHESLQREVQRLRDEVDHKNRELARRERLAALGELAAGVAHEVRNPLGAIQLYSGLLRREFGGPSPDGALRLIEKIDAGIRAIDDIVQDTLALAPRERELSPCCIAPLLDTAREFCQPVLTRQQVTLHTSAPADAAVAADPEGLRRVLINLICNAAEASPAGAEIDVTATQHGAAGVELRVQDRGCGIPAEMLERIFDPFVTTKAKGTGLGLTIAHRLIESFGGRLTAANRAAGGAEFVLNFPAVGTAAAQRSGARRALGA